jgi:hypothetical protein
MNKINRRFEDHLGIRHIPDDEDRDGPRNVGFFYSSEAADRPRRFLLNPVAEKVSDRTEYENFRKYVK